MFIVAAGNIPGPHLLMTALGLEGNKFFIFQWLCHLSMPTRQQNYLHRLTASRC